jgi:hypothetical protein
MDAARAHGGLFCPGRDLVGLEVVEIEPVDHGFLDFQLDHGPRRCVLRLTPLRLTQRVFYSEGGTVRPSALVRNVSSRTVVLEGPEGIRRVSVGDTVPGAGRIDSIVRWGNRWIVATSKGLITTD